MEPTGDLQVFVQDGRRMVPVRQTKLLDEIRLVDLRRQRSRFDAHETRTGERRHLDGNQPHRVLRVRRVGRPRRAGQKK